MKISSIRRPRSSSSISNSAYSSRLLRFFFRSSIAFTDFSFRSFAEGMAAAAFLNMRWCGTAWHAASSASNLPSPERRPRAMALRSDGTSCTSKAVASSQSKAASSIRCSGSRRLTQPLNACTAVSSGNCAISVCSTDRPRIFRTMDSAAKASLELEAHSLHVSSGSQVSFFFFLSCPVSYSPAPHSALESQSPSSSCFGGLSDFSQPGSCLAAAAAFRWISSRTSSVCFESCPFSQWMPHSSSLTSSASAAVSLSVCSALTGSGAAGSNGA
mmetsp:Transcript_110148/g.262523  ORF Transcript_110148/g.262523 Transcript_110148/m.262523 type:complete len:272 (-) Transcript_110148:584-1399(-)